MQEHGINGTTEFQADDPEQNELNEAWREVGGEFQKLGARLATSFGRSLPACGYQLDTARAMSALRDDLHATANRIDQAIREVSESARTACPEPLRATRRVREQSLEETRLLTTATLRKLNRQLDQLAEQMDNHQHR